MNEQILKLRKQAGLQPYYDAQEAQIERFVELIVRECAAYAFSDDQDHKAMLNHFGVEQ